MVNKYLWDLPNKHCQWADVWPMEHCPQWREILPLEYLSAQPTALPVSRCRLWNTVFNNRKSCPKILKSLQTWSSTNCTASEKICRLCGKPSSMTKNLVQTFEVVEDVKLGNLNMTRSRILRKNWWRSCGRLEIIRENFTRPWAQSESWEGFWRTQVRDFVY